VSGERRRPSSPGSNSQRFATGTAPDGSTYKIPQAKDSLTLIYVTEGGGWPDKPAMLLAYNETELTTGAVVEMEELRPGHGMGGLTSLRVLEVRLRLERWSATYGRVKRFVLTQPLVSEEDVQDWVSQQLENNS